MALTPEDDFVATMMCQSIILGIIEPIDYASLRGWNDHIDNLGFHECPYPQASPEALSWRIGWNDRALKESHRHEPPAVGINDMVEAERHRQLSFRLLHLRQWPDFDPSRQI